MSIAIAGWLLSTTSILSKVLKSRPALLRSMYKGGKFLYLIYMERIPHLLYKMLSIFCFIDCKQLHVRAWINTNQWDHVCDNDDGVWYTRVQHKQTTLHDWKEKLRKNLRWRTEMWWFESEKMPKRGNTCTIAKLGKDNYYNSNYPMEN